MYSYLGLSSPSKPIRYISVLRTIQVYRKDRRERLLSLRREAEMAPIKLAPKEKKVRHLSRVHQLDLSLKSWLTVYILTLALERCLQESWLVIGSACSVGNISWLIGSSTQRKNVDAYNVIRFLHNHSFVRHTVCEDVGQGYRTRKDADVSFAKVATSVCQWPVDWLPGIHSYICAAGVDLSPFFSTQTAILPNTAAFGETPVSQRRPTQSLCVNYLTLTETETWHPWPWPFLWELWTQKETITMLQYRPT